VVCELVDGIFLVQHSVRYRSFEYYYRRVANSSPITGF